MHAEVIIQAGLIEGITEKPKENRSSVEETNAPPMLLSKMFAQSQYKLSFKGFLEHWIECRQQGKV